MKYLTSSTTALSMVVAVVLFVVATLLEGERPPPDLLPEESTPNLISEVRRDSPVRDEAATRDCRSAEEELLERLDASPELQRR